MEFVDTLTAFIAWLWFWGWRIFLTVFLVFIIGMTVTSHYKKKRMREYVGHPIDWLTVMSTARWNTRGELAELMNTRCRTKLFKVYSHQDRVLKYSNRKLVLGLDLVMIIDDLAYLEDEGYVEQRIVYYDKVGNVFPESVKEVFPQEMLQAGKLDLIKNPQVVTLADTNIEKQTKVEALTEKRTIHTKRQMLLSLACLA